MTLSSNEASKEECLIIEIVCEVEQNTVSNQCTNLNINFHNSNLLEYIPIPTQHIYYVVIGNAIFPLQDHFDFDFTPPDHIEFVFIGSLSQAQIWGYDTRHQVLVPEPWYYAANTTVVVLDLYDYTNNLTNTLVRRTPYKCLDPLTDAIKFIGTWEQIRTQNIINLSQLHRDLHPRIDFYDRFYVRFPGAWGPWAIQDSTDWDFIPPSYIEVDIEFLDLVDSKYELFMVITFNLLDKYRSWIGYYTTHLGLIHGDIRPIPTFTGTYTIGTLRELGGAGS